MISHIHVFVVILGIVNLLSSCVTPASSQQYVEIKPHDIERLDDSTKSYMYLGDSTYISMRPGYGVRVLFAHFDSVSLTRGTNILYISGQVLEGERMTMLPGAYAFIGTIDSTNARLIGNDRSPPSTIGYYRINVQHKAISEAEGRFALSAPISPKSYLVIAHRSDLICLYHVGSLVVDPAAIHEE